MSMTDPIGDMLTRIRNASSARHEKVLVPASRLKARIAEVLQATRATSRTTSGTRTASRVPSPSC